MEIAQGFTDAQWKSLRFNNERDWIRGIAALRRRLVHRFIKPVRRILRSKKSGFAVLALDCLLIETLEQFLRGVSETPRGEGEQYFVSFLTNAYFGTGFDDRTARLFYQTVRCGILHQAEVRGSSLVRRDHPLVGLSSDKQGIVVNPVFFHKRVEAALTQYLGDLRSRQNHELRKLFRAKMDHIARVKAGV